MSIKSLKQTETKERAPTDQRIRELEQEISKTKYNKRTQHHIGLIKAKIRLLKEKQESRRAGKGKTEGYSVRKTGDGTIIIVGFPSVGKSTLLNAITNANSPIASYAFTTLTCIPGLLDHNHAKIQVLDVPGIVSGAASGRGRGKEVLACALSADLVLILLDVFYPQHLNIIEKEIYDTHIRLDQEKPDVKIVKKSKGGIAIGTTVKLTSITKETITSILQEFRITNADVVVRSDITPDQLIDAIEGNKRYIPGIIILNKIDMVEKEELERIKHKLKPDICISANEKIGTEELKELIFQKLRFIRIYCKEAGKKADLDVPLIMFRGCTLRDMCAKLHKDFAEKFKFARIWGKSSKFPGQKILNLYHKIMDGDIIEIHLK